jgi:uncharacterized protein (DUF1501 family)
MSALHLSRRHLLALGAVSSTALAFPAMAFGAETDKRFVFIILRGALDGLSAAPPIGDPNYASARRGLALPAEQTLKIDSTFALHPSLKTMKTLADAGQLRLVHATATAYRDRSHFDAQNVLETGATSPFARDAGWLNVALGALPAPRKQGRRELGVAVTDQTPLLLRGAAPITTWSPSRLPEAEGDTVARLMALYQRTDPALATALDAASNANGIAAASGAMTGMNAAPRGGGLAPLAKAAAGFLRDANGPTAAVMEMTGWDTHANQGLAQGQLARVLALLDDGIATLRTEMGPAWANTIVVVATEFGRTVAMNGGGGSDHGTGAAAFVLGGAVKSGATIADWPGLSQNALYEGRDLKPTTDLRAVLKGVLADHMGVPEGALGQVFPGSATIPPLRGLINV